MRCFCGVCVDYRLPFIWGHEGAICYLDNKWCSLENLPITQCGNSNETKSSVSMETRSKIFLDTLDSYGCYTVVLIFLLQLIILQLISNCVTLSWNGIALNFIKDGKVYQDHSRASLELDFSICVCEQSNTIHLYCNATAFITLKQIQQQTSFHMCYPKSLQFNSSDPEHFNANANSSVCKCHVFLFFLCNLSSIEIYLKKFSSGVILSYNASHFNPAFPRPSILFKKIFFRQVSKSYLRILWNEK